MSSDLTDEQIDELTQQILNWFPSRPLADRWLAAVEARAAARTLPPPVERHIECNCVPALGPSHCHPCSDAAGREMSWTEAHGEGVSEELTKAVGLVGAVICGASRHLGEDVCPECHLEAKDTVCMIAPPIKRHIAKEIVHAIERRAETIAVRSEYTDGRRDGMLRAADIAQGIVSAL